MVEKELGDISEDEEGDSEDEVKEDSPNGERTEWQPAHIQQSGNDDEDWDKKIEERLEWVSFFEDFADR